MNIAGAEPDIIMLTEIIPKAQVLPISLALLSVPGYALYLNFDPATHRLGTSGKRGVCIFVKNQLRASELKIQGANHVEHVWIELCLSSPEAGLTPVLTRV